MGPTTSPEGGRIAGGDVLALISLGSNIRPYGHIARALRELSARLEVRAVSSLYASPAKGAPGTPPFLNAAVAVATRLSAERLKYEVLRPLEAELGRVRGSDPNEPRVIDLDLSLYGDLVIDHPAQGLVLPDPEILTSAHVALPLAEIAGEVLHPVRGVSLADLARPFRGDPGIRIVRSPDTVAPPTG